MASIRYVAGLLQLFIHNKKGYSYYSHFADDKGEVQGSWFSNLTSALRPGLIQQGHGVKR